MNRDADEAPGVFPEASAGAATIAGVIRRRGKNAYGAVAALCLVLVFFASASAARYALLFGSANGGSEVVALRFVDNDIRALKSVLIDHCGFRRENIISISEKGPDEIADALDRLARQLPAGEDNLLLLYYTGHADRENLKMGERKFPITEMKRRFSAFPAAIRIGIFDACQSGSFTRLKGGALAEPFLFKDTDKIKGEVILSSSSPTENAQESDLYGNSIFTFHFVNALRGSGDISGDGRVTLSEAYQYSYNHTVSSTARTWGGVQHPSYQFRIQGEGDVVLADLTTGATGVLLEASVSGAVTIFDSLNNIVADLNKETGSRMVIALNPGAYQIVAGGADRQKWKTGAVVRGSGLLSIRMQQFEKIDPVEVQPKGGEGGRAERFRIGISVGGGYGTMTLVSCAEDLGSLVAGAGLFGIQPVFIDEADGPRPYINLLARVQERYLAMLGYSWLHRKLTRQYSGTYREIGDDKAYAATLDQEEQLDVGLIDFGVGFRCPWKYVRGIMLHGGVCVAYIDLALKSVFSDGLYDVTGRSEFHDRGLLALPWIGGGYAYTLFQYVDISLQARYRYQSAPHRLAPVASATGAADAVARPRYDLRGVDASLSLTVSLVSKGGEK